MQQLKKPVQMQEYMIDQLIDLQYEICPMDDIKERVTECFKTEIVKSANQQADFGQIDESTRLELIKYANADLAEGKDLELRLQVIF